MKYDGYITEDVANYALDLLDVDKCGLDQTDQESFNDDHRKI